MIKIYITFNKLNNLHVVVSTTVGHTIYKKTYGFFDKSSKLKTLHVQKIFSHLCFFLESRHLKNVIIIFQGNGFQKFSFLKEFFSKNLNILKIFYVSSKSFNGCRKKKQRRL
jgi:ribosomal protein S11